MHSNAEKLKTRLDLLGLIIHNANTQHPVFQYIKRRSKAAASLKSEKCCQICRGPFSEPLITKCILRSVVEYLKPIPYAKAAEPKHTSSRFKFSKDKVECMILELANLMVLATGAGSLMFSHLNDAGFWLFKEYFNLSIKDTLRTWTVMETSDL